MSENLFSYVIMKGKELLYDKIKGNSIDNEKRKLLEEILREEFEAVKEDYLKEISAALSAYYPTILRVEVETVWRAYVHSGSPFGTIPFEIGIAFDPVFNIPYIPASTIKGAVRRVAKEKGIESFFGSVGEPSKILFTDAYPTESGRMFHPEVINPHYKDVENELKVRPIPIVHAVIAPGVRFRFLVGCKEGVNVNKLKNAIKEAFRRGVGGKTNLGYSRYEVRFLE